MTDTPYHIPALLEPTIQGLDINASGVYADATFGGGGHSRAIMQRLGPQGHLYGFDRDMDAFENCIPDPRFTFVHSNFRYMENFMRFYGVEALDGIVADLGVSFHHFDTAERGFSFRADAPLDMRMNRQAPLTAADVLNSYSEEQLAEMLRLYGDIRRPQPFVRAIAKARGEAPLLTTAQLAAAVAPCINPRQEKKEMAQIFQALRIVVNDEMRSLEAFLQSLPRLLRPGGRVAILTYHSLEDRLVKNFLRSGNVAGEVEKDFYGVVRTPLRSVGRSPIVPSEQEIEANPRARSAKLRVAELVCGEAEGK